MDIFINPDHVKELYDKPLDSTIHYCLNVYANPESIVKSRSDWAVDFVDAVEKWYEHQL